MAVTYSATAKDNRMTAIRDLLNSGKMELLTGADAILATWTLNATSGSVSSGTLTFSPTAVTATASGTGTAAKLRLRTSGNADVITDITVGTGGTDVILDSVSVTAGQDVNLTTVSVTHG